jgi:subtilisin family serine protease
MPSKICSAGKKLLHAATLISAAVCLLLPLIASAQDPVIVRPPDGPAYREGRILVIPKAGRAAALGRFHNQTGARLRKVFPRLANIQVLELPQGLSARDAIARYRQSGHAAVADLDYWIEASTSPNDPSFANGDQWHLNNLGQAGGLAGADIHATEAWSIRNSASNIIVAVIDSGIRLSHQDLTNNLWTNPGEIAGNGLDDDGNGYVDDVHGINTVGQTMSGNPNDDFGHGTHVSGIIGASGNNGVGVSGVAWKVRIMPCKFLDGSGNGSFADLVEGLNYAILKGAKVINLSIESSVSNAALSNAFESVRSAGIIVTAAAGNSGTDNDVFPKYPASFPMDNIVTVTATTRTDDQAFNYGATSVHLGAPGVSIFSTRNLSDSSYTSDSGTSFAAPCVAGAAALLLAEFPGLTYRQIIDRLLGTVDPLPSLAGRCITGGRLNLARALSGGFTIQPTPYSWVPTNGMTAVTLANDGVSTARPLPFTLQFGGRDYTNIYVGANGIIGFTNSGLNLTGNMDMPTTAEPNAIICPYWDDLNPAGGGSVWFGTVGTAPYRAAVVSWVDVPHTITAGGQNRFTLQAILHESGQVAFQYAQVDSGNSQRTMGRSATIGLEDFTGAVAAKYSYNGDLASVTNNQAMLFVPHGSTLPTPTLTRPGGPQGSQFQLLVRAQVGSRCIIKASDDLSSWVSLATNVIPSSGVWNFTDTNMNAHFNRFYRAASEL